MHYSFLKLILNLFRINYYTSVNNNIIINADGFFVMFRIIDMRLNTCLAIYLFAGILSVLNHFV